jgi:large subunit ribosomal protein L24
MVKRHTKPIPQRNVKGGIVEREGPIHLSNLMVVDPETDKPTRVARKRLEDGKRVRIAKRSGAILDK